MQNPHLNVKVAIGKRQTAREKEKEKRIAFPFPIFPANFPGYSRSPLAPPRSLAIECTWEGTDECDYKWYQPAVLQEHKTANRRPARVPHSWERILTDNSSALFIRKKVCGSSTKDTTPLDRHERPGEWSRDKEKWKVGVGRKNPPSKKCRSRSRNEMTR